MEEKAVLKVNADGEVLSCAKGADVADCGYKGGKVCGKCGAFAVTEKGGMGKPKPEDEMMDEEESMMEDDEMEKGGMMGGSMMGAAMNDEEDPLKRRAAARKRRLQSMGMKSAEVADEGFLCALERKMHPNGGTVCATCPGGCAPESNLPTILEVEGMAEEMFGGKVLDSGYGYSSDLFLVEMQRKDGKVIEAIFDGSTSECLGWQMLNNSVTDMVNQKSAQNSRVIGIDEAAEIATKSIKGDVVAIEADKFDGVDAWVVEIEGKDGNSYDMYVGLDGEELGYDVYSAEEAAEIEAEAAEIALKRAYSDMERGVMAERGFALPDGSYPIKDEADLRNAIQAYGRAKDKPATLRHIMKRARDLGLEDLIPDNWKASGKSEVDEAVEDDGFLASLMEFEVLKTETEIDTDSL